MGVALAGSLLFFMAAEADLTEADLEGFGFGVKEDQDFCFFLFSQLEA